MAETTMLIDPPMRTGRQKLSCDQDRLVRAIKFAANKLQRYQESVDSCGQGKVESREVNPETEVLADALNCIISASMYLMR